MKIVVLDGYTLNPGDISWEGLRALGDCQVHDRTPTAEVVSRAAGAEIVLTNKTVLGKAEINGLPNLQYIGVLATGYNVVDISAARERDIPVTNIPTYGTQSVAQMTFALLLEMTQQVGHHAATVRDGRWSSCSDFCYWDMPLIELEGLTLGVVGFGRIGQAVAKLALAFGMKVLSYTQPSGKEQPDNVEFVGLDELFERSDVVSLHCPLTSDNKGFVNGPLLRKMKPSAFLLNTSRGPLVDQDSLVEALTEKRIAGAALDVLTVEPPPADNPLFKLKNCIITPHIAWATRSARSRLMKTAVQNVKAFLDGAPQNVVNASE